MRKFTCGLFALTALAAATSVSAASWPERNPIIYGHDRANEDWSYVDHLSEGDKSFAEKLKRIEISENGDWKLSLSANAKMTFDNRWNHQFDSDVRKKNDLRARLYLGADVTYQDWARFYGELRVNHTNLDATGPIDDGGTDFHQLFAEFQLIDGENQRLSTRLGRQEIYLNEWQMMNREPSNVQQSWNVGLFRYHLNGINFDIYYGEEVFPWRSEVDWTGNFDDRPNGNRSSGVFANWHTSLGTAQAYFMDNHLRSGTSVLNTDVDLQVFGLHLHSFTSKGVGYMADLIYQTGNQGDEDVSAYMGYVDVNYNWQSDWNVRVGVNAHYASGSDGSDSESNTFNPLWTGDPQGFGFDGGYSNVMQAGAYGVMEYSPGQSIVTGFLSTWRASLDDGIYTLGMGELYGANSDERYAYTQTYLQFINKVNPYLTLETKFYYSMDSDYIKDVVGEDSKNVGRVELAAIYNF